MVDVRGKGFENKGKWGFTGEGGGLRVCTSTRPAPLYFRENKHLDFGKSDWI